MKAIALFSFSVFASAQIDQSGTWRVRYVDPRAGHKTFSEVLFSLGVHAKSVTGMAHLGAWPGNARISDGQINGDQVSFTVIGQQLSSTGYPRIRFEGTLQGKRARLMMYFGYLGRDPAWDAQAEMVGEKLSDEQTAWQIHPFPRTWAWFLGSP